MWTNRIVLTEPLGAGETWESNRCKCEDSDRGEHACIIGTLYADERGSLLIEQSSDGENWDFVTERKFKAGEGLGIYADLLAPYYRARLNNESLREMTPRLYLHLRRRPK